MITKNTHTTYSDILNMTPSEREYFLGFIVDDFRKQQEAWESRSNKK